MLKNQFLSYLKTEFYEHLRKFPLADRTTDRQKKPFRTEMLIISEINNNNNFKITIFTPSFFSVHIVTMKESNFCNYKICLFKRKWLIFNSILHLQQFLIMSYTIYLIKIVLKQNLKRINCKKNSIFF